MIAFDQCRAGAECPSVPVDQNSGQDFDMQKSIFVCRSLAQNFASPGNLVGHGQEYIQDLSVVKPHFRNMGP